MRLLTIAFFLVSVTQAVAIDVKSVFEATRPSVLLIVAYDENDHNEFDCEEVYFTFIKGPLSEATQ
ncbi:hypothetical protein N8Z59_00210 [Planktomarina temperata]|nr:hypothetical protein [Planktomarina temperata]